MSVMHGNPPADEIGRCAHCGDVVGAYEQAVWAIDDGRVVIGSPLGVDSRDLRPSVAAHLHLGCWNELLHRSRNGYGPGSGPGF